MTIVDKLVDKEVVVGRGVLVVLVVRLVLLVQQLQEVQGIHWVLLVLGLLGHLASRVHQEDLQVLVDQVVLGEEEVVVVVHMALVEEVVLHSTLVSNQGHNQHRIHHCRRIAIGLKTQMKQSEFPIQNY